ncbi:hypothetical protein B0H10DRAFT_1951146 [Mycena sp. CBHHK59/15]|nr:hypothetical protein B0H10DRAFT_1951146 [Mycena sp. CBHHK59/15]
MWFFPDALTGRTAILPPIPILSISKTERLNGTGQPAINGTCHTSKDGDGGQPEPTCSSCQVVLLQQLHVITSWQSIPILSISKTERLNGTGQPAINGTCHTGKDGDDVARDMSAKIDHISTWSWIGDIHVKNVSTKTGWMDGRMRAVQELQDA